MTHINQQIQFSIAPADPMARIKPTPRYVVIDLESLGTEFDEALYDRLVECDAIGMIQFGYEDMYDFQLILLTSADNGTYTAALKGGRQTTLDITKGNHTTITRSRDIVEGDIELEDLLCS